MRGGEGGGVDGLNWISTIRIFILRWGEKKRKKNAHSVHTVTTPLSVYSPMSSLLSLLLSPPSCFLLYDPFIDSVSLIDASARIDLSDDRVCNGSAGIRRDVTGSASKDGRLRFGFNL